MATRWPRFGVPVPRRGDHAWFRMSSATRDSSPVPPGVPMTLPATTHRRLRSGPRPPCGVTRFLCGARPDSRHRMSPPPAPRVASQVRWPSWSVPRRVATGLRAARLDPSPTAAPPPVLARGLRFPTLGDRSAHTRRTDPGSRERGGKPPSCRRPGCRDSQSHPAAAGPHPAFRSTPDPFVRGLHDPRHLPHPAEAAQKTAGAS